MVDTFKVTCPCGGRLKTSYDVYDEDQRSHVERLAEAFLATHRLHAAQPGKGDEPYHDEVVKNFLDTDTPRNRTDF